MRSVTLSILVAAWLVASVHAEEKDPPAREEKAAPSEQAPVEGSQEAPEAEVPPTPEGALEKHGGDAERLEEVLKDLQQRGRDAIEAARKVVADAESPNTPAWKKDAAHLASALAAEEFALLEERVAAVRGEVARRAAEKDAASWAQRLMETRKDLDRFIEGLASRKPSAKEAAAAEEDVGTALKAEEAARKGLTETEAALAALPLSKDRAAATLKEREEALAKDRGAQVPDEEKEEHEARLPLLERSVALAQARGAHLDVLEHRLAKEKETRERVLANATAVVLLTEKKRDALTIALKGEAAAEAEARQHQRDRETEARKKALAEERSANGELARLAEAIEARLEKWKKDHAEFLGKVSAPQQAEIDREEVEGTTALTEVGQSERLKVLDEELGKLDVRVAGLEEELAKLRPERDERLLDAEVSAQVLRVRIEDTRKEWEELRQEPTLDPIRAQHWQEGMLALGDLERERLELLDRLENAYEGLVAEIEAYKKDVEEHREAVSEWRGTLASAVATGRTTFFGLSAPVSPWVGVPVVILAVFGAAWLLHVLLYRWLQRRVLAASSSNVKMLLRLTSQYAFPVVGLLLAWALINGFPLPEAFKARANTGAFVVIIGIATYFLMRGTIMLMQRRARGGELEGPARLVIRIIFAVLGMLIILDALDVSITPILTGLGVSSIAVALALQDTLSNFFAGIYVTADKPIRKGDYVKLDTGDEGYVVEVSWRSTRLRTIGNNTVIVPNHKLGQCVITNYHLPETSLRVPITIVTSANEDPARVEEVLIDEMGKAAKEIEGVLPDHTAQVRLGVSANPALIEFTVLIWVREFADQYTVTHQVRRRIANRFRREEIDAPGSRPAPAVRT